MRRMIHLGCALGLLMAGIVNGLSAGIARADDWRVMTKEQARLEAALGQTTEVQMRELPLHDAMQVLADGQGIRIVFDEAGLREAGVSADAPISAKLSGVTLRSSLKLLLVPLGLNYIERGSALVVTSRLQAEQEQPIRIYNVRKLLDEGTTAADLARALEPILGIESLGQNGCQIAGFRNLLLVRASPSGHNVLVEQLDVLQIGTRPQPSAAVPYSLDR